MNSLHATPASTIFLKRKAARSATPLSVHANAGTQAANIPALPERSESQLRTDRHLPQQISRRVLIAATIAPAPWLRGAMRYAREHDWHLVTDMVFTGAIPQGWQGDGVLAFLPYQWELVAEFRSNGRPCVACGDVTGTGRPVVSFDYEEIGGLAADHLLERAHRDFAWAPLVDDEANQRCMAGFQKRLAEHGRSCVTLPAVYCRAGGQWKDNWTEQQPALVDQLQHLPRPTAILAFNDGVALDVINAARQAGLTVPGDLAVLGVGDSLACTASPVPLSSIDLDVEEVGYRAAALLDDLMRGGAIPDEIRIRPREVITRLSTDVTAVTNARVARALSFIAENYHDPMLNVGAVAEATTMSRRQLERTVRQETGNTVNEHIVRARMGEASRLLRHHPRARSSDIAALVGLPDAGTFFRTFRRFYGMSPGAHRDWAAQSSQVRPNVLASGPAASRSSPDSALAAQVGPSAA